MVVIRKPKKIFFLFLIGLKKCWCLNSLKHEIEFIIKSNESLAQNKKKQAYEHGRRQNEWTT